MATKSIFKRWDGSQWVEYYFKTSADLIDETTSYKVMTAAERTAISTYLTSGFNGANQLIQADANGLVPAADIPTNLAAYLKTANPSFTGNMTGAGSISVDGSLNAIWNNSASLFQFRVNDSQEGFVISSEGGATLRMDQGIEFNRAVAVGTPTATNHATTKTYVDALVATGLKWAAGGPVLAATTANITLSGLQTIDGFAVVDGGRVLVKNQTTASQNGVYTASTGAWTKVTADSVQGTMVFVENGTTQNDWTFQATTATTWVATSKVDTILAGTSLTKSGNTISVANSGITGTQIANTSINLATKTETFGSVDNSNASYDTWGELVSAGTVNNVTVKLNNLHAAVGLLRGTANYNTNNTQTIAGAYAEVAPKNRTYQGTASVPTGLTLVTGDLYFYELA
jgi:hypothetical protein